MGNLLALTTLLLQYTDKLQAIGALLAKAHAENRDVSNVELDDLFGDDDAARVAFDAAIAATAKPASPPTP
jgi:hypothetical protein